MKKLLLASLLVFIPSLAFAAGEVNGRIRGVVTEADSGAPVPGATITATSPALIGGAQTVITNDDGAYELVELPGGKYTVQVAYAGVKPIERKVLVRQGETLPLDIQWSAELANAEVTEVQAERHMTKPDSTQIGTVISAETESKLATQRTYTDVALQVAGTKADGAMFAVKGANRLSNHYLIDGMDITDIVTGSFAQPVNFDAISSMEILTGGMEAQYNALGGVVNVNTSSGSDEFHLDTSFYVNNQAFSANQLYGVQGYEGALAFNPSPAGPTQGYKANATVSGPIIKQKLWYSLSLEYDYTETSLQPGPDFARATSAAYRAGFLSALEIELRAELEKSPDPVDRRQPRLHLEPRLSVEQRARKRPRTRASQAASSPFCSGIIFSRKT